jgi:hypothetical protein
VQCVIKSYQLFSDVDFPVIQILQWFSVSSYHTDFLVTNPFQCLSVPSNHLHYDALKYAFRCAFLSTTRYGIRLYKDMSSRIATSDYTCTPPLYLHAAHALRFWKCLTTYSLYGTCVHSAVVSGEQRWPFLCCRQHMEGGIGCVLTLTQVAM